MSINAMGGKETIYLSSENSPRRPLSTLQPVLSDLAKTTHQLKAEKSLAELYCEENAILEKSIAALQGKSEKDAATIHALNKQICQLEETIAYQLDSLRQYEALAVEEGKLQEELSCLRQDNEELSKHIETLRCYIEGLEAAEKVALTQSDHQSAKILELETQNAVLEGQSADLETQNAELQLQLLKAGTEKSSLISDLEVALTQVEVLQQRIECFADELRTGDQCRNDLAPLGDRDSDLHAPVNHELSLKDELDMMAESEYITTLEATADSSQAPISVALVGSSDNDKETEAFCVDPDPEDCHVEHEDAEAREVEVLNSLSTDMTLPEPCTDVQSRELALLPKLSPTPPRPSWRLRKRAKWELNWCFVLFLGGLYFLVDRLFEWVFGVGLLRITKRPSQHPLC